MTAFNVLQIAVAVMCGNILTKLLFTAWGSIKAEDEGMFSLRTAACYLGPLGLILLVMAGSSNP